MTQTSIKALKDDKKFKLQKKDNAPWYRLQRIDGDKAVITSTRSKRTFIRSVYSNAFVK